MTMNANQKQDFLKSSQIKFYEELQPYLQRNYDHIPESDKPRRLEAQAKEFRNGLSEILFKEAEELSFEGGTGSWLPYCICGHKLKKSINIFSNDIDSSVLVGVGSDCAKKFLGTDLPIRVRRKMSNKTFLQKPLLLDEYHFFLRRGYITRKEHCYLTNKKAKRSNEYQQTVFRINRRIRNSFLHKVGIERTFKVIDKNGFSFRLKVKSSVILDSGDSATKLFAGMTLTDFRKDIARHKVIRGEWEIYETTQKL